MKYKIKDTEIFGIFYLKIYLYHKKYLIHLNNEPIHKAKSETKLSRVLNTKSSIVFIIKL